MKRLLAPLLAASALLLGPSARAGDPPPAPPPAPPAPSGAAGPCIPAGDTPPVDKVVSCVQSVYDASQTFSSDFSQRFWVKAYNKEKSSHGHVVFSKPGKMSWSYDDAESTGNRVVSDGTSIKVYEASNKQMYEQPLEKSQYPAALSFLTGTGKLADTFNFEVMSGAQMKFPGGVVLVGTPKTPTPAYSKVLFYVDQSTANIRRVLIVDAQGNRNRFDFDAPVINQQVGPETFKYTPPPGTSVIHP